MRFIIRHLVKIKHLFNARGPRGQGLVEFALILPALLLVVVSIIDFGRLMFTISSVASASRDAARYGASVGADAAGVAHYQDCAGIRETIQRLSFFIELDIVLEYDTDGPSGAQAVESNYREGNGYLPFPGLIRFVQTAGDSSNFGVQADDITRHLYQLID